MGKLLTEEQLEDRGAILVDTYKQRYRLMVLESKSDEEFVSLYLRDDEPRTTTRRQAWWMSLRRSTGELVRRADYADLRRNRRVVLEWVMGVCDYKEVGLYG